MTALLSIGELADSTGVTVSAIRYYGDVDLVAAASRVGGKRRFTLDAVGRVSFIRRAQAAGFSLDEVRSILNDDSGQWHQIVDDHLETLRKRRDELDVVISMLEEAKTCGCSALSSCPRLEL